MSRGLVIAIGALPPRPRRLSDREIADIFGGCITYGSSPCNEDCDCCPPPRYPNEQPKVYCESRVCKYWWKSSGGGY
jgi:hypothetical protein